MNLALPAVLIILGILPGIVFFHSYFSGKFPRQLVDISPVSEVALYVIFAIPLGLASIWTYRLFGLEFNYELVARLMAGAPSSETGEQLGYYLKQNGTRAALLYVVSLGACVVLGNLARKAVWRWRLDVAIPFLRPKHEWFYTLTGRLAGLPRNVLASVDLMLDHPDGSLLVQGIMAHLEIGNDGKIDQLILDGARRGSGRGAEFHWKNIPGHRFIVTGECIRTINMRYLTLEVESESQAPEAGPKAEKEPVVDENSASEVEPSE